MICIIKEHNGNGGRIVRNILVAKLGLVQMGMGCC